MSVQYFLHVRQRFRQSRLRHLEPPFTLNTPCATQRFELQAKHFWFHSGSFLLPLAPLGRRALLPVSAQAASGVAGSRRPWVLYDVPQALISAVRCNLPQPQFQHALSGSKRPAVGDRREQVRDNRRRQLGTSAGYSDEVVGASAGHAEERLLYVPNVGFHPGLIP